MTDTESISLDLDKIIATRAPKVHRFTPRFLIASLERLICQERMNKILEYNRGRTGADFCHGVLEHLSIKIDLKGEEHLPPKGDRKGWRVLFVSNHPLGGLDGMALIDLLTSMSGNKDFRFIVNDLLMNITPLSNVFLPVNTISGKQTRANAREIDRVLESDCPVAIFPAGLCSRLIDGKIQDVAWNKMFVNKAIQYQRDIIPLHFKGHNSSFFYKFAKLRKVLRIPVNLEMSLLPREVFGNENSEFRVTIGERIDWTTLSGGNQAPAQAKKIRDLVYTLSR